MAITDGSYGDATDDYDGGEGSTGGSDDGGGSGGGSGDGNTSTGSADVTQTLMDPDYLALLTERFGTEDQRSGTLWNFFMYGVEYNPNEEVWTDTDGNIVDSNRIQNPDYVPATEATTVPNPEWTAWNNKGGDPDQRGPEPPKTITTPGTPAQGEEYLDDPNLTRTTRGALLGYDPNIISESELIQMGIQAEGGLLPQRTEAESAGLTEDIATSEFNTNQANYATDLLGYREETGVDTAAIDLEGKRIADDSTSLTQKGGLRESLYDRLQSGLDVDKQAKQAAADASQAYDKSKEGQFTSLALRGINPTTANTDDSMNRASLFATAKTKARDDAGQTNIKNLTTGLQVF